MESDPARCPLHIDQTVAEHREEFHITLKRDRLWQIFALMLAMVSNLIAISISYGKWSAHAEQQDVKVKEIIEKINSRDTAWQDLTIRLDITSQKLDDLKVDVQDLKTDVRGQNQQLRGIQQNNRKNDHIGGYQP